MPTLQQIIERRLAENKLTEELAALFMEFDDLSLDVQLTEEDFSRRFPLNAQGQHHIPQQQRLKYFFENMKATQGFVVTAEFKKLFKENPWLLDLSLTHVEFKRYFPLNEAGEYYLTSELKASEPWQAKQAVWSKLTPESQAQIKLSYFLQPAKAFAGVEVDTAVKLLNDTHYRQLLQDGNISLQRLSSLYVAHPLVLETFKASLYQHECEDFIQRDQLIRCLWDYFRSYGASSSKTTEVSALLGDLEEGTNKAKWLWEKKLKTAFSQGRLHKGLKKAGFDKLTPDFLEPLLTLPSITTAKPLAAERTRLIECLQRYLDAYGSTSSKVVKVKALIQALAPGVGDKKDTKREGNFEKVFGQGRLYKCLKKQGFSHLSENYLKPWLTPSPQPRSPSSVAQLNQPPVQGLATAAAATAAIPSTDRKVVAENSAQPSSHKNKPR